MEELESVLDALLKLKAEHPERFERLLWTPEHLEVRQEKPGYASLLVRMDAPNQLKTLDSVLTQLARIHEVAVEAKNDEASRHATYKLISFLDKLTIEPGNEILLDQILNRLMEFAVRAMKRSDNSMFAAAAHWYGPAINRDVERGERDFDLSYLSRLNAHLFYTIRECIELEVSGLYEELVSYFQNAGDFRPAWNSYVIDYFQLLLQHDRQQYFSLDKQHGIFEKSQHLEDSVKWLNTINELNSWIAEFVALCSVVKPYFGEARREKSDELEGKARQSAIRQFKYNQVLEVFYKVGAYCIFRREWTAINCLWDSKQPSDAHATWGGTDLVPENVRDLVTLHFGEHANLRRYESWHGHHGSLPYYDQHFLLSFLRLLGFRYYASKGSALTPEDALPRTWSPRKLHSFRYQVIQLPSHFGGLQNDKDLLNGLGFNEAQSEAAFARLREYLDGMAAEASLRLETFEIQMPPSPKRVTEYTRRLATAYEGEARVRGIIKRFDRRKESDESATLSMPISIERTYCEDKAAFFEDWPVSYSQWGEREGWTLARDEDLRLLKEIVPPSVEMQAGSLSDALLEASEARQPVVVVYSTEAISWLVKSEKLVHKGSTATTQYDLPGLQHFLLCGTRLVPVVRIQDGGPLGEITIFDAAAPGLKLEYDPPTEEGGESHILVEVRALSEEPDSLKKNMLPPSDEGGKPEAPDNLQAIRKKKVLVKVVETLTLSVPGNIWRRRIQIPLHDLSKL